MHHKNVKFLKFQVLNSTQVSFQHNLHHIREIKIHNGNFIQQESEEITLKNQAISQDSQQIKKKITVHNK